MKKILITHELPSGRGGLEIVVSRIASILHQKKGHIVKFALFDDSGTGIKNTDWLDGQDFIIIKNNSGNKKIQRLVNAYKLSREIIKYNPDIIVSICPLACFISKYASLFSIKHAKVKIISWMHTPPEIAYKKKYLTLADFHLAICDGIKKQLVAIGINKEKVTTVYNPVTPRAECIEKNHQAPEFIYVGRLQFNDQKVIKELLDAASIINGNFHIHIIGDGDDRELCQQYSRKIGVWEKITWHGWQGDPWGYILNEIKFADSLILPSKFEGFPLVLLEAMAMGIMCIASDCRCGPDEIITDNENGMLYSMGNAEHLASKMQAVINGEFKKTTSDIKSSVSKFHDDVVIEKINTFLITHSKK